MKFILFIEVMFDAVVSFGLCLHFGNFLLSLYIINKESMKLNSCLMPFSCSFVLTVKNLPAYLLSPVIINLAAAFPLFAIVYPLNR